MKFFSVDSPFYRFLTRFMDVLKLNFMWILFSLPVITIGASTVAAMSVALKMVDDEEGYIGRIVLGIIAIIGIYAVYLDFQFFNAIEGNPIMFLIIGIVSCYLIFTGLIYAFPLVARYENTLINTIKNSLDISRKYFGRTLFLAALLAFEYVIFNFNTTMLFFGIIIGPAFVIFTVASVSKRIFQEIEKEPGAVIKKSSLPEK